MFFSFPRQIVRQRSRLCFLRQSNRINQTLTHQWTPTQHINTVSTSTESTTVTSKDFQNLKQELASLRELIKEQSNQSSKVTRAVSEQTIQLEARLWKIESHVSKISGDQFLNKLNDFFHDKFLNSPATRAVQSLVDRSKPFLTHYKYYVIATLATIAVIWRYRSKIVYERTSQEVADLARLTLEQESLRLSIQETLKTVANNPSTLHTLNDLVQQLITHERTQKDLVNLLVFAVGTPEVQKALLDLLQVVFQDRDLQQLTGEFLLKGLDMEDVKAMLDAQTAQLVRETVSDKSVQQATAVGVQRSLWYLVTPPFFWRFIEKSNKDVKGSKENLGVDSAASSTIADCDDH